MKQNTFLSGLLTAGLLLFTLATSATEQVWIDVRTDKEYQESSIPGHPNILYTEIADKIAAVVTDKDAPIYLYCGSGRRAGVAKETLEKMGYTQVTNAGGIDAVKEQLATESTPQATATP